MMRRGSAAGLREEEAGLWELTAVLKPDPPAASTMDEQPPDDPAESVGGGGGGIHTAADRNQRGSAFKIRAPLLVQSNDLLNEYSKHEKGLMSTHAVIYNIMS